MKAKLVIECDDERELLMHLSVVTKQLRAVVKTRYEGVIDKREVLSDNNCYGYHRMVITPEKSHVKEKKKR